MDARGPLGVPKIGNVVAFNVQNRLSIPSGLQFLTVSAGGPVHRETMALSFDRKMGEMIILRDSIIDKIVSWINNLFKQIGDNAVQFDPQHAVLYCREQSIRFVLFWV